MSQKIHFISSIEIFALWLIYQYTDVTAYGDFLRRSAQLSKSKIHASDKILLSARVWKHRLPTPKSAVTGTSHDIWTPRNKNLNMLSSILFNYKPQNISASTLPKIILASGIPRNFVCGGEGGGGSTNSVEGRGQGSEVGSPLIRGSEGSCNLVQEISFHIVKSS